MRRLTWVLVLCLVVLGLGGVASADGGVNGRDCLSVGCGGGGAMMSSAQFAQCCQQAATNRINAAPSPASEYVVRQSRELARLSVRKGTVEQGLKAHWPGGYPAEGITVTKQ